jgi:hypothetical protein
VTLYCTFQVEVAVFIVIRDSCFVPLQHVTRQIGNITSYWVDTQARGQQHRYTHITSGGVLVAVADEMCLLDDLEALDLSQARLLARLSLFWERTAK